MRKAQTFAKAEGLSSIQWTYDPLEGANGNLYIRKLGAVVSEYYEDYYGPLSGKRHKGSSTDRFWTELRSDALPSETPNAEMIITQQGYQDYDKSIKCLPGIIAVEIPDDFNTLKAKDPAKAERIRIATRHIFKDLFAKGYQIRWFQPEENTSYYIAIKNS